MRRKNSKGISSKLTVRSLNRAATVVKSIFVPLHQCYILSSLSTKSSCVTLYLQKRWSIEKPVIYRIYSSGASSCPHDVLELPWWHRGVITTMVTILTKLHRSLDIEFHISGCTYKITFFSRKNIQRDLKLCIYICIYFITNENIVQKLRWQMWNSTPLTPVTDW